MTASCALSGVAGAGVPLADALVATRLASSKREARDFLAAGSVSVNGEKVLSRRWLNRIPRDGN